MKKTFVYKSVAKVNLLDAKHSLLNKMNTFAILAIISCSAVGMLLNYVLRMRGAAGGMYFVYGLCGAALCVAYIYLHELTHAFAIISIKRSVPEIKFGKLVASCGAPMVAFTKAQYFFVASFPFLLYCAILFPLCILLSAEFFVLPFMPLCYNIFGSLGDMFMIYRMMITPRGSAIIDNGTDVSAYVPIYSDTKSL